MPKKANKGPGLKQLNKQLRRIKSLQAKTENPNVKAQLEQERIKLISSKNKVKKGGFKPKIAGKKKIKRLGAEFSDHS